MAERTVGVEKGGSRRGVGLLQVIVFIGGGDVALLAGRGRRDGKPDDAALRPFLLQTLHVAARVVLLRVGAAAVGPFEDDQFSSIFGERMRFAVAVSRGEIRRG